MQHHPFQGLISHPSNRLFGLNSRHAGKAQLGLMFHHDKIHIDNRSQGCLTCLPTPSGRAEATTPQRKKSAIHWWGSQFTLLMGSSSSELFSNTAHPTWQIGFVVLSISSRRCDVAQDPMLPVPGEIVQSFVLLGTTSLGNVHDALMRLCTAFVTAGPALRSGRRQPNQHHEASSHLRRLLRDGTNVQQGTGVGAVTVCLIQCIINTLSSSLCLPQWGASLDRHTR